MRDDMKKYFSSLLANFGDQAAAVLAVVQASTFCCSLIRRNGIRPHFPVAVVAESFEQMEEISSAIAIFSSKLVSLTDTPKEFSRAISSCHDDILFLTFAKGRYTEQNFEKLQTICNTGMVYEDTFEAVVAVFFLKWIPSEYSEYFSMVISPRNRVGMQNNAEKIAYLDYLEQFVLEKVVLRMEEIFQSKQRQRSEDAKDAYFWQCGIRLLEYMFQSDDGGNDLISALDFPNSYYLASEAAEKFDLERQVPEMFLEAITLFCPRIGCMVARKDAGGIPKEKMGETPLYDLDYYYFPEELFEKVCEPLLLYCPLNQVKAALESAGILLSQGRGRIYRTVKIKIDGTDDSPRYVRLKRALLDNLEGELTIEERINSKG